MTDRSYNPTAYPGTPTGERHPARRIDDPATQDYSDIGDYDGDYDGALARDREEADDGK